MIASLLLATAGCGSDSGLAFEYRNEYSRAERAAIEAVGTRAVRDARHLLPSLPSQLRLTVQNGTKVIPETGETAETGLPGGIYWTVDPAHPNGVRGIVEKQLRATLFHELYHLVREPRVARDSLIESAIGEGLATAFERDYGGGAPVPWGAYPPEITAWTAEFLGLPPEAPQRQWMFQHPDGRRWIGYKVGTHLADLACRQSGRTVMDLAAVPTAEVLKLAGY